MKVSHGIFLVGIVILLVEMIFPENFGGESDKMVRGLVSDDVMDKISTLYFFIIVIAFFFGGIVYLLEKGMERNPLQEYQEIKAKSKAKSKTKSKS